MIVFLKKYYGNYIINNKPDLKQKEVRIIISSVEKTVTVLLCGERIEVLILSGSFAQTIEQVERIIERYFIFEDDWNVYHGAAFSIDGITFLFLGKSQSGKTTLSAFLAWQKNVTYLAEEYVIINIKTKEVIPTPHSFMV